MLVTYLDHTRCGWGESERITIDLVHGFDGYRFLSCALLLLCKLLDGYDNFRVVPSEPFVIEFLDELWQWRLPPLLVVIRNASEFLWIEPKLSCHLDVCMGQPKLVPSVHPHLEPWRQALLVSSHVDSQC